ncbi:hypothetical protein DSO57_1032636 [Entomophthora muscae]|uniref:Uncharacterized protein n=1 Tax=Entomophthora muscae TaxID=34485 RepID=A0ACC2TYV6_9FUNG|nr:hypothetical protein DSO57_1032636 [Entomophthora muscae]
MSTHNNSQPSLRQVYQDLMAGMMEEDRKVFMRMPRSSRSSVAGPGLRYHKARSERGTATHIEGEEEVDFIFAETEALLILLTRLGFEDLQDWSDNIILKTASSPLATPLALLRARRNSEELPSTYPAIINQFGVSHHKETLYVYVQVLFAEDDAVTPIRSGARYHGSYNVEQLIGEVDLCLHVTAKDTSGFSLQHVYTITQRNQYVCEIARIWALEQSANPELPRTLGLDLQANTPVASPWPCAVKDNNPQLYFPLAASVAHFMWYPPKACSSGAVGFAWCCLEHLCWLAYQSKVSLPACYSYMEDVLFNCLTIGSAFSAHGGWGCLVNESNLCLPLCG